jgi:hypothetical protein
MDQESLTPRAVPTGRLQWLEPIAIQIADEAHVACNHLVEDIVIIAFEGLLNDPLTNGLVTRRLLLDRARAGLSRWLQEQSADRTQRKDRQV